ncbi:uracil DNA N-glycosylase Thp1 [Saxophila tyrrhenica]|uniref:Uracil DNA N-glycosylase Thp1 n=1 Tax=Saxophila tyrrhenica TaxID=1690608 RepID=A0AAV9PCN2_9PEZI|nr:uracil DNA N-glycosylase Thp1 [Saxophila tyrrhenica]
MAEDEDNPPPIQDSRGNMQDEEPDLTTTVSDASTALFKSNLERFRHSADAIQNPDASNGPRRSNRKRTVEEVVENQQSPKASPSSAKRRRQSSRYAPPSKYAHLSKLTDILEPNLIALFVGFNPGVRTATAGHASGCTDVKLRPEQDVDLPRLCSLGNTNIVDRPSKDAAELSKAEMAAGTPILEEKVRTCRPEAVCIVGKGIWEAIWRWRYKREIKNHEFHYGWQDDKERMGKMPDWDGARVFVATATSGLSASTKPAEKEAIWKPFGEWVKTRREQRKSENEEEQQDAG